MGIAVPFYNVVGVILLTFAKHENHEVIRAIDIGKKILVDILKNPLIWGCIIGGLLKQLTLEKGHFLLQTLDLMSSYSIPLSLICLGIQLNTDIDRNRLKQVLFPCILKLIISPLIGFLILYYFVTPLDIEFVLPILVLLGCPAAVASYVMATEMKADPQYAADIVLATTLFSMPTFFVLLSILKLYHFW